jgi:H+/gluconate symporter-like permease
VVVFFIVLWMGFAVAIMIIVWAFYNFSDFPVTEGVEQEKCDANEKHSDDSLKLNTYLMVVALILRAVVSLYQFFHLLDL